MDEQKQVERLCKVYGFMFIGAAEAAAVIAAYVLYLLIMP